MPFALWKHHRRHVIWGVAVYALTWIPAGVRLDRYGSRRRLIAGASLMAGSQVGFALISDVRLAIAASFATSDSAHGRSVNPATTTETSPACTSRSVVTQRHNVLIRANCATTAAFGDRT
jgi:hypothetical protein